MKAFTLLIPLLLAFASSTGIVKHRVPADNDDSGILPFTSQTPLGQGQGYVTQDGLAVLTVAGLTIGPQPVGTFNYASTVDGHNCYWVQMPTGAGGALMMTELPVAPGDGSTLTLAVQHYHEHMSDAGPTVHPCNPEM